ncbi:zinc finger protein 391-like [Corticium candelabrum]|uniref:zinc finger protein 391-like n=1 Tax=Corticium candelabrum TaxID=121492 RepID=UPI002E273517|nr:zinc finger protein 391-like [Corticium candelabrum]
MDPGSLSQIETEFLQWARLGLEAVGHVTQEDVSLGRVPGRELIRRLSSHVYVPELVSIQRRFGYADCLATSGSVTLSYYPDVGPVGSPVSQSPFPEKEQENCVDMRSPSTTLSIERSSVSSQPLSPLEMMDGVTLQETSATMGSYLTENDFYSKLRMLSEVSIMKETLEHQNGRTMNNYCHSPLPEESQNGSEVSDSNTPDEHHGLTNGTINGTVDSEAAKFQIYVNEQVSNPVQVAATARISLLRSGIVFPVGDFQLSPTQPQYSNKMWYSAIPVSNNHGRHLQLPSFQVEVNGIKHSDGNEESDTYKVKTECPDCVENCNGDVEALTSSSTFPEPKHSEAGPYHCDLCGDGFTTTNLLGQHMRVHTMCKPFTCHYCEKTFTQRSHLTRHLYTHTGEKPYKCPHCDRSFARSTTLTDHINTHTRSRPHKCWYCDKSFNQKSGLRYHIRTHTGERPFDCPKCSRSFISSSQLVKHICRPEVFKS